LQTNVPDFTKPPNWLSNSPYLNPVHYSIEGGSAAANISSEDWGSKWMWSDKQLLGHDQSVKS